MKLDKAMQSLSTINRYKRFGKVIEVVGLTIISQGPQSSIGDVCYIYTNSRAQKKVLAEVVGFRGEQVILMPYANINEISQGSMVEGTEESLQIKISSELIGTVLNALGEPFYGDKQLQHYTSYPSENNPPNPMERQPIHTQFSVGVRVIDTLLSIGVGQRLGIFAGSGVGKSTLMGMITKNSNADLTVIALIGERGREVKEFITNELGEEGLKRAIVVVATSDQPPLLRLKGAFTATAIAEYFRERGKKVLLLMDSITRVAMAQREIGLAIGEPPTTKGYTPSVFTLLPRLLERAGTGKTGSITAFYTVLVDGDDFNEPISDTVRGILDGHIVLDRNLAHKAHFPAINVLKSVSRVMPSIVTREHLQLANAVRKVLSTYSSNEDLISIGAYKKGSSHEIDYAIARCPRIVEFLKQGTEERVTLSNALMQLQSLVN